MDNSEIAVIFRTLDGFRFSAADFFSDRGDIVIGKALAMFGECTDINTSSIQTRNLITRILEEKVMSELESRTNWLTDMDNLQSGDTIDFIVEGRRLHGTVRICPKKLSVTLVLPSGRTDVRKASLYPSSGESYTQEPYEGSAASERGRQRVKMLLLGLACESSVFR